MQRLTFKQRFFRANLIGLAGGAVAGAIVLHDGSFHNVGPFLRCAAAGAFLAGMLLAGLFGRGGCGGWFLAGLGFSMATVLGVVFGITLLPVDALLVQGRTGLGTLISPISWGWGLAYVLVALWDKAGVLIAWFAGLAGTHLAARRVTFP